ncbi:hypothetical protein [Nocardioides humilatus]|uniref:hypothetical protein n=1 Tax=Nocardioides humilatus TaxID=2607660 RepID=UPI00165EC4C9|nr:hypothetical protein [Nocardioides humilatus]
MAVFTAAMMVILLPVSALAIDLGMERVTRADLQALADVVALDLARELTGKTQAQLAAEGNFASSSSAVRKSAARNGNDLLGNDLSMNVDWGSYVSGVWNTATDPPTGVKVTATADTDYSFKGGEGAVTRTAYAVASSSACYRMGTFVAAVNSGDSTVLSPLNGLFGANLTLVSYQALAAAKIKLGDIAAVSSIGSPTALLTGTVNYTTLLNAMVTVLSNQGGNSVAVGALNQIVGGSGTVGAINLGNVLHVAPTDTAALAMDLDVLDIVGSARLANGNYFLEVPNIQGQVPGIGNQFSGGLTLISAAQLACGRPNLPESQAKNSQLSGNLAVDFINLPSLSIPQFATLLTEKGTGTIAVNLADGTGQLVSPPDVHCGAATVADPHSMSVRVQTLPASYSLSADLVVNGDVKILDLVGIGLTSLLLSLGLPILGNGKLAIHVEVNLTVSTAAAATTSTANLRLPPNDTTPVQTGTSVLLPTSIVPRIDKVTIGGGLAPILSSTSLTNKIINELINANNGFVQKTLYPFIDNINNQFIGPVARMVGLRFGGADVYAVGATCAQPALWG